MSGETDIFGDSEVQFPQDLGNDVVQEVLKTGMDLRQYSRQIEKELKEVENKSIQDYIKESENIASLHNQITACDSILEKMESMLLNFQSDLGSISSEIRSLQRKSVAMSQQLSNREIIREPLRQFIEDMTVSEALIAGIMDYPVTEKEFLTQLQTLNRKINFVKEQSFKETKSCSDVKSTLEKLKVKAMSKIRAYLLEQINKFRKPMANYQVPQHNMLKYKFYFEFILANERNVAEEIRAEYVDTMSKICYSYFKTYSSRLMELQFEERATKDDLMGVPDTASRGIFHKASTLKHRGTVFSIGARDEVLTKQLEAPIMVPHTASKTRYHYEALFRTEQYALVDNACREYLFLMEFFKVRGGQAEDLFNQVMGKTLNLLSKNLQSFVDDCYDTIALFLCLYLVMKYRSICHKRAVPALDTYWDNLTSTIWPRFEYVFKLNIRSIKDCDPEKFNRETGPHYITRRYAEFSAAMVSVVKSYPCETNATQLLAELREAVQCFLFRMAANFPHRTQQLVFLINNYDLVLGVLMERTCDNSKQAESFREQLNASSSEYVEEVLSPHFGGIMQLVKESETLIEKGQADDLKRQEEKTLALVQYFTNNWKRALEEINREVLQSFPNLVLGTTLVQHAMTQLVQYYHRLHKILPPNARTQLTNIHHIKVEMKKYKTNY